MPEAIAAPAPVPAATPAKSSAAPPPRPSALATAPKPEIKPADTITPPDDAHALQDDFDELYEADGKTKPERKVEKPDKAKPEDDPKSKVNGDSKPKDDKPKDDEPKTNPELRTAYAALKDKVAKDEPKLKRLPELEAKIKELESRDETTTKATQQEIESVKKRNTELEQHMRFVDYEKSTEYRDQFQKPYEDAWGSALRELKGLTMKIEDPKTGEEIVREVTQADIAYFANLDPATRRTEINRLFPEDREEVKRHINNISTLAEKANAAREKAKGEAETHAKTQTEAQRQSQAQRAKLWKQTNESLATKYPKWFGKDEGDPEGNALFDKGKAFSDLVFSPTDLTPERIELLPQMFKEAIQSSKPFSQEALVKLHAIAANKLANHDRAITKLKAATARIAELEKSLKEYEDSGPDTILPGARRNGAVEEQSDEDELRALDRR